ncbi:MFS transporter [Methanocella sp. MCL-LM]|uniref:MFS transporter n=1 Tax=Methanocella sp. MCL-LM TaxID=3412035 RepID=UPI003C767BFD
MVAMVSERVQLGVLVAGMFFLSLGFSVIMPVLPYYSQNMGATAFDLGLLMASYSVMQLIFTPFLGELSDRIGRKPVFLIGLFGYGVSFLIYGFATQLWMLFAARMIGGILSGGIYPASLAYIADITSHKDRGRIMGMLGASSGLGMIFGPALAGGLSMWGLTVPFFTIAAASFGFVVLGYLLLRESKSVDVHRLRPGKVSLLAPLSSRLWLLFLLALLVTMLMSGFQGTFAYYLMDRFNVLDTPSAMPVAGTTMIVTGPGIMAIMFTVMGITGVICQGMLLGIKIELIGERFTVITGLFIAAASFFLVLSASELVSLMLFACTLALGTGLVVPCLNSLVSKRTDEEHQGAAMGVIGSYNSLGRIIGPPVGGFSFDIHMDLPFIILGFLAGLGGFVAMLRALRLRALERR